MTSTPVTTGTIWKGNGLPRERQVEVVLEEHRARVDAGQYDVVELEAVRPPPWL